MKVMKRLIALVLVVLTISSTLVSALYGVDVEVCSMHRDGIRVCVPAHLTK